MILRRFTKHATEQNWFAVGLDVLVVITGIFLGMQVTEWNNERKERIDEIENLIQLSLDMMENTNIINERLELYKSPIDDMAYTAALIQKSIVPEKSDQRVINAVQYSTFLESLILNLETYKTMMSTGAIANLRNHQLRRSLLSLEQKLNYYRDQLEYFRGFTLDYHEDIKQGRFYRYDLESSSYVIQIDMDQLATDKPMKKALISQFRALNIFRDLNQDIADQIIFINQQLKETLGTQYPY